MSKTVESPKNETEKQSGSGNYNPIESEKAVLALWNDHKIYDKLVKKNHGHQKFYYLDGPPYTTGQIHLGHAWGKSLRDSIMRFKRMNGFDVLDQPGFDMHGLPIENQVEKELGLKDKQEIITKMGVEAFTKACEKYAIERMAPMIEDFKRIGIWMDWKKPYMTIKNEYIEGAWYALHLAEKNGYLYEGKKAMTWCPHCATALAKHELEYEDRKDESIFVKFKILDRENEYLVIWTTTPWTLPFNLGVMVHPDFDYIRAKIKSKDAKTGKETETGETWIVAKAMSTGLINAAAEKVFDTIEEFKGSALAGIRYIHPFLDELDEQKHIFNNNPKAHSVLMSSEFVSLDAGSGLVHCAPGCGPEDFEVGRQNGLPAYNVVDEYGRFPKETGKLAGLTAKKDDSKFIEMLEHKHAIVAKSKIDHEYAHCWRCKTPVIYKATNQWFLAVEKLKNQMISENENINWTPDWGGNRWFKSWLDNLQDWCISRQRFWGIPLPIWKCECGEIKVIGTIKELEKITGKKIENLHRPYIDAVKIKCENCGKQVSRVEDILDVWFDSGAAPWAAAEFPSKISQAEYESRGTPDLILEGKDQIRGWFNSLTCMSMVSFKKIPFKAVYMHGFINDSQGRKFSKSLKNGISPYEIVDKHGADALRYYMNGAAAPGLDINYNPEDMLQKTKNLAILWNLHKFLLDYSRTIGKKPADLKIDEKDLDITEKYILSKLNSTIKEATEKFNTYKLNEVSWIIEDLYLKLSRTYIQNIREKSSIGTDEEKEIVLYTIYRVLFESIKMLAPIAPFITETMYQNLRKEFDLSDESVHLLSWPKFYNEEINKRLEENVETSEKVLSAILFAREKSQIGVRWPIKEATIVTKDKLIIDSVNALSNSIKTQANIKEITIVEKFRHAKVSAKPEYSKIAPTYKELTPKIIAKLISESADTMLRAIEEKGKFEFKIDGKDVALTKDHLKFERAVPDGFQFAEFSGGEAYLDTARTPELEGEGFAREVMRRIQQLRKDVGLNKNDVIVLAVSVEKDIIDQFTPHTDLIAQKCGAESIIIESSKPKHVFEHEKSEKIKGKEFGIYFDVKK